MPIYTNYHGWMMTRHQIKHGSIMYQGEQWNLDDECDQLRLILALIEEGVVTLIKKAGSSNPLSSIHSLHLQFKKDPDTRFNTRDDGRENVMQPKTFFANLKQTGWVEPIT